MGGQDSTVRNRDPQLDVPIPKAARAFKQVSRLLSREQPIPRQSLPPRAVTSSQAGNPRPRPPPGISASARPNNRQVALLAPPTAPEVNAEATPLLGRLGRSHFNSYLSGRWRFALAVWPCWAGGDFIGLGAAFSLVLLF